MEGEFEQIMTKIRWSMKENSNYITAELQVLLTFIFYFLQILGVYLILPNTNNTIYWTVLGYYHRACGLLVVKFETVTKRPNLF